MNQEQRRQKVQTFLASVDWQTYDYTRAPGADMNFPDLTEAEMANREPWIGKHYNRTSRWNCVHVPDLNEISDGEERYYYAVYGVPVAWPRRSEDERGLYALIDQLDAARAQGGQAWAQAMDQHGLVDDNHYLWMRVRSFGYPDAFKKDWGTAQQAMMQIDAALQNQRGAAEILRHYGFHDPWHYAYVRKRVAKLGTRAWEQHNALLKQTFAQLDERFAQNKAALSGELAPFQGVSMEAWAGANARLAQGQPLEAVLAQLRIERPQWDAVNAEWNARMSRDTTATIATVYGQAFMGAGQGQFGGAAQAVSASMQSGFGQDVKSGEPISFEQWIKIQAHMNAATAQGIDPNSVLAEYRMSAADWGTAGGFWAMKMNSNPMQYLELYQQLSTKYAQAFAAGGGGRKVEF